MTSQLNRWSFIEPNWKRRMSTKLILDDATRRHEMRFELTLHEPFSLAIENQYFGGWPSLGLDQSALAMTFPVEGWRTSAAVILHQHGDESILGEISSTGEDTRMAWQQALATLSLDNDAAGWLEVGRQDPVIGSLQNTYHFLRPVLFHSPYEAAAAFAIGHLCWLLGPSVRKIGIFRIS